MARVCRQRYRLVSEDDEQLEIVAVLDAVDRKIDLHRRKLAVLDELFKTLLHKLITGEIRLALPSRPLGADTQALARSRA